MEDAVLREADDDAEADNETEAEDGADADAARCAEEGRGKVVAAFLQSLKMASTCGRVAWTKRKEGKRGSVTMRLRPCLRICLWRKGT